MNNLEFIEKEIDTLNHQIEYIKSNMKKYVAFRTEGQLNIDEIQLKLNHLNQIKNILEAWEVVKPNIKYEEAENEEGVYMEYILYLEIESWKPEAFKIQKALEVKNE